MSFYGPTKTRESSVTRGDLFLFDAYMQHLHEDLEFEKTRALARDPRQAAEKQYSEESRDEWLAKNTKPLPEM